MTAGRGRASFLLLALCASAADAGRTRWTSVGPRAVGNVLFLAAAEGRSRTLFAATSSLFLRSEDAGETWTALPIPPRVTALAADAASSQALYAGTSFSGGLFDPEAGAIYKSGDGGASWSPAGTGVRGSVLSLAAHPRQDGLAYCGTTEGLFRTSDGGRTWTALGGPAAFRAAALAVDPSSGRVYAGGDAGVYASGDGGVTWSAGAGLGASAITALAVDPERPDTVFAASNGGGVWTSSDGGARWAAANDGLVNLQVFALVLARRALYAGTNGGVFRSGDLTAGWEPASEGLPVPFVIALAAAPDDSGLIYASLSGPGVYRGAFDARLPRVIGAR